ncbi:MAG: type II toxin-antitoxin system VapC family toxin [Candidatus Eremiobacteraeota bacterium]|nr:type II toxin-antitoxin system VapC family toxin [Candidatus Eremiobacteraeota bacterium]MBV8355601.1 type II toxin-antitoxin system VapC family toxin [Candidatus Eremiobacteraeota bacterium]
MRYLLDTNVISDLIRNPGGTAAQRAHSLGAEALCTSIIVAAELRYGVTRSGSLRLAERVEEALRALSVLPFAAPADAHYARIRDRLARQGRLIGTNDMLIAAHTLALGYTIVTDNVAEFARIEGLRHQNWRTTQ